MRDLRTLTGQKKPLLGTFSKGIDGSVSLNFGVSGGANCDSACTMHPDQNGGCYAARAETRPDRAGLANKLARHDSMPAAMICGKALLEIQELTRKGVKIPWLRISTNGSLPQPDDARDDRLFKSQLRSLMSYVVSLGIPVHIPVETYSKARFYRSIIGDLVTIRESAQSQRRFQTATGAVSTVAGDQDDSRIERVECARQLAAGRRESTGRKCIVCPAITNSFAGRRDPTKVNPRAKCGACVACSDGLVDIVFPRH